MNANRLANHTVSKLNIGQQNPYSGESLIIILTGCFLALAAIVQATQGRQVHDLLGACGALIHAAL
jgi:hypothetical protein